MMFKFHLRFVTSRGNTPSMRKYFFSKSVDFIVKYVCGSDHFQSLNTTENFEQISHLFKVNKPQN